MLDLLRTFLNTFVHRNDVLKKLYIRSPINIIFSLQTNNTFHYYLLLRIRSDKLYKQNRLTFSWTDGRTLSNALAICRIQISGCAWYCVINSFNASIPASLINDAKSAPVKPSHFSLYPTSPKLISAANFGFVPFCRRFGEEIYKFFLFFFFFLLRLTLSLRTSAIRRHPRDDLCVRGADYRRHPRDGSPVCTSAGYRRHPRDDSPCVRAPAVAGVQRDIAPNMSLCNT